MNFSSVVFLTSLAAIGQVLAAAPEVPAAPAMEKPAKDLAALVRDLADESYKVREAATAEIWRLGESVLPELTAAAESEDPEQALRARDLLRKIQLHITPDTDPSVILLVERYLRATPSEKASLLGKMKGKRAWRQMLKLYASETSAEVREKLQEYVNGVAIIAARERISKGDSAAAREFLEMAPADSAGLLALAEFHRSHGTLEEELKKAKAVAGKKSAFWQLALYRASGDLEGARQAALEAGETRIAAAMSALAGDPIPWLKESLDGFEVGSTADAYTNLAIKRWLGQKPRKSDFEPLVEALSARRAPERGAAMNALFLLNEIKDAEPVFMKSEPFAAFLHFQLLERNDEALRSLGLDPQKPDYRPWIEKRIAKLSANDVEDEHQASTHRQEMVALANFLERRGLHDELFAVFSEPMAHFAEKSENDFLDFLGSLFKSARPDSGAPALAKRVGAAWAGKDEERWEEVVIAALGDDDENIKWWSWLEELSPKESQVERFDALLTLFNIGTDPGHLRERWMARAWKAIENAQDVERGILAERIAIACYRSGDVSNTLRAIEMIPEQVKEKFDWNEKLLLYTAANRWDDAADVISKQLDVFKEANQAPSVNIHAYAAAILRRAGREDEAKVHDEWLDKLALGNPMLAAEIGGIYAFGGDYTRSAEWTARAVRESEPESDEFTEALAYHSKQLLDQGKWKEAAATAEVSARQKANAGYGWSQPLDLMHQRLLADMARALANLESDRAQSIAILENCHRMFINDGSLADDFFPAIRKAGLIREHDEWFRASWERMNEIIAAYPESDNIKNTAAWFASRAARNLDQAEKLLQQALDSDPAQPAYLDTMAEIQFAKGKREKALEWSQLAMNFEPNDAILRRQHERFRTDPLPK